MTAWEKNIKIVMALDARGIDISSDDAHILRRAELTLQRWSELECGDSDNYKSWSIERDEKTGKPYMVTYRHDENKARRRAIADREKGALKRIEAVCKTHGLHYFHQTDPRGCALYISKEPMTDSDYTKGVPICV